MTLFTCVKSPAVLTLVTALLFSLASSEITQIIVVEDGNPDFDHEEFGSCGENQFECRNGDCIRDTLLCDGRADCSDQSDETQSECDRSELTCPNRNFRCDYGACVNENAICNGVKDCLDNSDELLPECPRNSPRIPTSIFLRRYDGERNQKVTPTHQRIYRLQIPRRQTTSTSALGRLSRPSRPVGPSRPLVPLTTSRFAESVQESAEPPASSSYSFCFVPPQPLNGRWKLHRSFCNSRRNCDIPQGTSLRFGSRLVYTCAENFMMRGNSDVFCEAEGKWSSIPVCVVPTCSPLNSISRAATCSRFGDRVSCRSPVLPYTWARVTCRLNYGLDMTFITGIEQDVQCSPNGRWEPEPITCSPVCGMENDSGQRQLAINGIPTEAGAFPWHSNLWKQVHTPRGPELQFRCSGTIVQTKFVVTAAHCVVDEKTGVTEDPRLFRVTAGKSVNDGSTIVQKVKNVYRYCEFFGLANGFASDIAVVELIDAFEFSPVVNPACLDITSLRDLALKPGVRGKLDGYGRRSASTSSPILQTVEVTQVSNAECQSHQNPSHGRLVISNDEFCGIYSNETTICDWDNGGGLVVKKDGLWHLTGIFIMDLRLGLLGNQEQCDTNPYSIYTKVSPYMAWIQDIMFQLQRYKSYPLCAFDRTPPLTMTTTTPWPTPPIITSTERPTTIATPTTTSTSVEIRTSAGLSESGCVVPPQPDNGEWKLYQDLCNNTNCSDIPQGVMLGPGSQLVYTCDPGFRIKGNSDVFCGVTGRWSAIPECIEIRCTSLESVSRMVTCYRSNNWSPCNSSSLPGTRAVISCRVGYREDTSSLKTGEKTVQCNQNGEWELNPITCVPVCGVMNTRVTPTIINGTAADITEFPWHATLYRQMNATQGPKEFICGATIIQNNLLLTAAHCVYDEVFKTVELPEKFSVAAGNRFRNYDSQLHDPRVVQKSTVKNIYVPCEYYGLEGNYASDIALIELREPFQLSNILLPACLDVLGNSEQILETGAVGNFAGFGRTATGSSSAILMATKIPYVSYSQCKMSRTSDGNVALIVRDKFCGGGSEDTAVCDGDSGGGLTFENNGVSNVLGILSVNLGVDTSTGERTCNGMAYSLYTKVSSHMAWIRNVMSHLERDKTYPSCGSR